MDGTFPDFVLTFLAKHYPDQAKKPIPTWVKEALAEAGIDVDGKQQQQPPSSSREERKE